MGEKFPRPVRWLSPKELARSGIRAVLASTIGAYVDQRRVLADPTAVQSLPDATVADTVWIDYVADVGDGYEATHAVALALAAEQPLSDPPLLPGSMLILGGDQVYPTPSIDAYERRFLDPYSEVLEQGRTAYAIPGNHDWYDGLSAFTGLFCVPDSVRGTSTPQNKSYWAAQPHPHWAIWGIDTALDHTIDTRQKEFFENARDQFDAFAKKEESSRGLIVCLAQPFWEKDFGDRFRNQIRSLVPASANAVIFLSGDKHHLGTWGPVSHETSPSPRRELFVTAGGGGAYLSLTHDVPHRCPSLIGEDALPRQTLYPSRCTSRMIGLSALWRIWMTPSFVLMLGLTYLLLGSLTRNAVDESVTFQTISSCVETGLVAAPEPAGLGDVINCIGAGGPVDATRHLLRASVRDTACWFAAVLVAAALFGFARKGEAGQLGAVLAGVLHAVVHVLGVLVATGTSMWVANRWAGGEFWAAPVYVAGLFTLGAAIGTLLFAIYLIIAAESRVNVNELSSAVVHQGWKNFIRISLTADAATLYLIGLKKPDATPSLIKEIEIRCAAGA